MLQMYRPLVRSRLVFYAFLFFFLLTQPMFLHAQPQKYFGYEVRTATVLPENLPVR